MSHNKLDLYRRQNGLEDTLEGVVARPDLLDVLISNIVVVEAAMVLSVLDKLIPDPSTRFPCARHHTRSRFHVIRTVTEEG